MRVVTKLVKTEFTVHSIGVDGERLLMTNSPQDPMPVKAYVEPEDVAAFLKAGLKPQIITYLLRVPLLLRRRRTHEPTS